MLRKHLPGVLAAAAALALSAGVAAIVVASGGSRPPAPALASAARRLPAAAATAAGAVPSRQASTAPSRALPAAPATAPGSGIPPVTNVRKPPPVVDGVARTNVGSDHSPRIQQELSGPPVTTPPPAEAGALGVDVADYQHPHGTAIDWTRVAAAGYKFAFIKATEGDYYGNPYYASDLAQAKAAGLYATGYHFAVPNVSGGASQADYAVRNGDYTADGRTLPLALDIEYNPYGAECYGLSKATMTAWIWDFVNEYAYDAGVYPVIYTTNDWWSTCTSGDTGFAGYDPLWVACYCTAAGTLPAGYGYYTFWQYADSGSEPGDQDVFNGAYSRLQKIARG
jgi:GH25 family lysozyme M1 (1,4-beta-N-acetylmuramidase)